MLGIVTFIPLVLIVFNYYNKLKGVTHPLFNLHHRNLIYSYLFFILSLSIAIKAKHPAAYYMFIPLAGFLLTLISVVNMIMYYLSERLKLGLVVILSGLLVFHLYNYSLFFHADSKYMRLLQHSNNMKQTFFRIANQLELSKDKTYHFVFPPTAHYFYLLRSGVDNLPDHTLINFIYQVDGDYQVNFIKYNDITEVDQIIPKPDAHYIIIDSQYNLLDLY